MAASRSHTLQAFKGLLKQIRKTFDGDNLAIRTATGEARNQFKANKGLTDEKEIHQKVADAHEATAFIRESIVQARKTSSGSYEVRKEEAPKLQQMAQDTPVTTTTEKKDGCCGGGCH